MPSYTFSAVVPGSIAELRPRVEAALKEQGFGVLTEIDVAATLKAKLDLDLPGYLILGACNPRLASRAIAIEPSIGALLPCNVVLREADGGGTVVEIVDPDAALGIAGAAELQPVAAEATERLRRVLETVAGSGDAG
jgi:uncharacterized protein (DUF302 family)